MFDAMSAILSSLTRRLVPLRRSRRKSVTSSAFVARRPFFPCGAGHRDVASESPLVVVRRKTPRKVMNPRRMGDRKRGRGGDNDDPRDGDEPCVWRRTILLGRRCQPLEFTGAIHYDCEGQRLWQSRTPPQSSSPLLSPVHPSVLGYMDRA